VWIGRSSVPRSERRLIDLPLAAARRKAAEQGLEVNFLQMDALAIGSGWIVESIEPARFEVLPGIPGAEFTPGGAKAWFAPVRRA